jgi:tetratricopeptide (TPR) repeat protein
MLRLDEALAALDEAVRTLDDLGARWELASVLGERATVQRLRDRFDDAERDVRSALAIVRDLGDRALVSWIIEELFENLLEQGDREGARRLLAETESELPTGGEPGSRAIPLRLEGLMALVDGDTERALRRWLEILELERGRASPNVVAGVVWFIGRVFGPEHVGGPDALEDARSLLESVHWRYPLEHPDRVLARVQTR